MTDDAVRAAKNEVLFRRANEVRRSLPAGRGPDAPFAALCECAVRDCSATVVVPLADYERVRASGRRFLVVPGHEDPAIETVVEATERYRIVEKRGPGIAVAEEHDPR